jgi:hypothetical protein
MYGVKRDGINTFSVVNAFDIISKSCSPVNPENPPGSVDPITASVLGGEKLLHSKRDDLLTVLRNS